MRSPGALGARVLGVAALGVAALVGCVDTELGLDATIQATRVEVMGDSVRVSMDLDYRVGEHASGERAFQPQTIDLYVGDALVASVTPAAPAGFVSRLSPGQSESATLSGTATGVASASSLCGANVTVLFRWLDGSTLEIGMTEASTTDVACP